MTLNGNKINLPASVIILVGDKFKIRLEPLLLHVMLKQGRTWFPLITNDSPETV